MIPCFERAVPYQDIFFADKGMSIYSVHIHLVIVQYKKNTRRSQGMKHFYIEPTGWGDSGDNVFISREHSGSCLSAGWDVRVTFDDIYFSMQLWTLFIITILISWILLQFDEHYMSNSIKTTDRLKSKSMANDKIPNRRMIT